MIKFPPVTRESIEADFENAKRILASGGKYSSPEDLKEALGAIAGVAEAAVSSPATRKLEVAKVRKRAALRAMEAAREKAGKASSVITDLGVDLSLGIEGVPRTHPKLTTEEIREKTMSLRERLLLERSGIRMSK